jgi:hypothetical protein
MEDLKTKKHIRFKYGKVDDNAVSLWLETAGLTVFMSLVFFLTVSLF